MKPINIRNRIIELKTIKGSELSVNPNNWRIHTDRQAAAVGESLVDIGIADALLAYYSERANGALTLVNGHMRRENWEGLDWPVLILDLNDQEADYLIKILDPLAALAQTDATKLRMITQEAEAQKESIKAALRGAGVDIRKLFKHIPETQDTQEPGQATQQAKPKQARSQPQDRERYPLAIVLDRQDYGRWQAWRASGNYKSDTEALKALLSKAIEVADD